MRKKSNKKEAAAFEFQYDERLDEWEQNDRSNDRLNVRLKE